MVGEDFDTSIEFMNYWALKYGACEVSIAAVLRDMSGTRIAAHAETLKTIAAHRVDVRALLLAAGAACPFEGSLEIEIVADVDIRFAYPALLALYRGACWQAAVHTYCRHYHPESGDTAADLDEPRRAEETNWLLPATMAAGSFLVLHNGLHAMPADRLEIELFNEAGERLILDVPLPARPPYATTRVELGQYGDLAAFLAGGHGFGIARYTARGVLPRLLAGQRNPDGSVLTMTHSHVDSRDDPARFALEAPVPDKPMFISVPVDRAQGWNSSIVFYPTSLPADYTLRLRWLDQGGRVLAVRDADFSTVGERRLVVIDVSNDVSGAVVVDAALVPAAAWVPTRYHLGLLVAGARGALAVATTGFATLRKPRYGTYWTPLTGLADRDEQIAIINTDTDDGGGNGCEMALTLYRTDAATLTGALALPPNGSFRGGVDALLPGATAFLDGGPGWLVMRPHEKANLHLFFLIRHRVSGALTADHGF